MKNLLKLIDKGRYLECQPAIYNVDLRKLSTADCRKFAYAFLFLKEFSKAIECFEIIIYNKIATEKDLINYGIAKFRTHNLADCIRIFSNRFSSEHLSQIAKYHIAEAMYYLGDDHGAQKLFYEIESIDKDLFFYSRVYLLILKYLSDDILGMEELFLSTRDYVRKYDKYSESYIVYLRMISQLVQLRIQRGAASEKKSETIYILGDSHSLALDGLGLNNKNFKALWCMGIKAHHFSYKNNQSIRAIEKIKQLNNENIIFYVGEIDLRGDEGVLKYSLEKNIPVENLIEETINNYLAKIIEISSGNHISIMTIPCTKKGYEEGRAYLFDIFNKKLSEKANQMALTVLDYATWCQTRNVDTEYIDDVHRSPNSYYDFFRGNINSGKLKSKVKNEMNIDSDNLGEDAKKQFEMLKAVDAEIRQLQIKLAIAQTARIAYARALQNAVPASTGVTRLGSDDAHLR